jgi:MATE family multidrug resistance protein
LLVPPSKVTTAQVFAIAGPAMIANLTTPLIGIVSLRYPAMLRASFR